MTFAELQGRHPCLACNNKKGSEGARKIRRTRSRAHGSVMDKRYVRSEITSDERMLRVPAKRAIAALAATLIPSGASVLIEAGSTCLEDR